MIMQNAQILTDLIIALAIMDMKAMDSIVLVIRHFENNLIVPKVTSPGTHSNINFFTLRFDHLCGHVEDVNKK